MARAALVRLLAFVLVLFGTFGTAYGLGRRLPGNPESKPHTHGPAKPSPVPPGFHADGYTLVTEATQPSAASMALHITGPDGAQVARFVAHQGAAIHVVLIRFDDSGFEHLTPEPAADGSFVVPIDEPGKWHIIVDSQPEGALSPVVLTTNVDDEVPVKEVPLPAPQDTVEVDGLTVTRDGLTFEVTANDGSPATELEPYLGQPAHLFAIRQGDLAYRHPDPVASGSPATLAFTGDLSPGTNRLFLEFGYQGHVTTAAFTVVQP
jgi:hypothetical protein